MISQFRHEGRSNMEDALLEMIRRLGIKQAAITGTNPDEQFASFSAANYNHGNANTIEDLLEEIILRLNWFNGNAGGTASVNIVNSLFDLIGTSTGPTFTVPDLDLADTIGTSKLQVPVLAAGESVVIPDVQMIEVDGSITNVPFLSNPTCSFSPIILLDKSGNAFDTIESWVPEYTTTVGLGTAGAIIYLKPVPTATLFKANGDTFSGVGRGYFTYNKTIGRQARLAGVLPNDWYVLAGPNAFGNNFRFTTSTGNAAQDGKLGFTIADFDQDGALLYYVIDHLTGIGIYTPNISTNTSGIDWYSACAEVEARNSNSFYGFNDWFLFHSALWNLVTRKDQQYFQIGNPFRRGIISGHNENSCWLGEFDELTTLERARLIRSNHTSDVASAPDAFLGISTYMCRNHYM